MSKNENQTFSQMFEVKVYLIKININKRLFKFSCYDYKINFLRLKI